jgi:hypothetical protein
MPVKTSLSCRIITIPNAITIIVIIIVIIIIIIINININIIIIIKADSFSSFVLALRVIVLKTTVTADRFNLH